MEGSHYGPVYAYNLSVKENKLCRPLLWGPSGFAGIEIYALSMLRGARAGTPEEIWGPRKTNENFRSRSDDEPK